MTSKTPRNIKNIPATLFMIPRARPQFSNEEKGFPINNAVKRNGKPKPTEKTASKKVPWKIVLDVEASSRIEPNKGPTQGDQPRANKAPSIKELNSEK